MDGPKASGQIQLGRYDGPARQLHEQQHDCRCRQGIPGVYSTRGPPPPSRSLGTGLIKTSTVRLLHPSIILTTDSRR